jgi:hypothetical protein
VIGVGIALIVLGVVFLFVIPWVGIVAGLVGLALAFLWIVGFGRPWIRERRARWQ